jgi:intraflagellar transport protein 172
MNFKHVKNLQESIDGMKKIFGISWSPNLQRIAVAHVDERRMVRISLYDETCKKREMFSTKAANKNSKSYIVKEIAFSPDSTKLAVCQTDCIIFVYNLGRNWGDKKVICNKFEQNFPVTSMIWPNKKVNELFFGVADGKIKKAILKNNTAQALYSTGSFVIAMSYNYDNTCIISSHMDNSIFVYNIEKNSSIKICSTPTISYCLSFLLHDNTFLSSSLEKKIFIHNENGDIIQNFDYSNDPTIKDFSICKINTNYDIIAIGNYNKLFIYGYNNKQNKWEESCVVDIQNYFSFTALCWKQDFGILLTGSLCGSLDMFESCLKKNMINDKYEITYISLQQITVKDIEKERRINIKTNLAPEILKVEIKNNNFLVITTDNSLIVGDLTTQKYSEVPWNNSDSCRFDFNNLNTCLVYVNDEVAVIEFGNNEIIGYFRTEYCHPNLISARLFNKGNKSIKLIAYLIDPNTIYIHDLLSQSIIINYTNDCKIEYLEFGKSGNKLIYRDTSKKLNLLLLKNNINENVNDNGNNNEPYKSITILNLCSFVQWVPNTEILVAQSHQDLFIWYNLDNYQNPQVKPINGIIDSIAKNKGKIEIYINDDPNNDENTSVNGGNNYKIYLDENLVNLSIALDDKELTKALMILENLPKNNEYKYYWQILSEISLEEKNLMIAQRCFAALGNFSKMKYLKNLYKLKKQNTLGNNAGDNNNKIENNNGNDGNKQNENDNDNIEKRNNQIIVDAKLLLIKKKFDEAKKLLLSNNLIQEAIDIFKEIHKYLDAIEIAEQYKLPESELMKKEYLNWLVANEMYDEIANIKIKEGSFIEAVKYYIQGDMQVKAVNLIIKYRIKIDKNTITYLLNSIDELGLTEIAKKLRNFINENQ